jgi:hypothetical protein
MSTLQIHVGGTFADTERRVADALARHARLVQSWLNIA